MTLIIYIHIYPYILDIVLHLMNYNGVKIVNKESCPTVEDSYSENLYIVKK